jgi:hypothetical protein
MRANAMRRHDFDPIAFVFGLAFTGLGLLFLVGKFDVFNHARWVWPGLLVVLGLAVLVGARGRGAHDAEPRRTDTSAVDAGPPPDLDSIEPPVGPDAFRLPGWPHIRKETEGKAEGKAEAEPVPEAEAKTEADPKAEAEVDPDDETTVSSTKAETEVDPAAETTVLPTEARTEVDRKEDRPESG